MESQQTQTNIHKEIKETQFTSEREIASIDLWYKVRREQLLKQLESLDNEYSTMLAECNVKWATRLLELDLLQNDYRRIQYKPNNKTTNQLQDLGLNDFDD